PTDETSDETLTLPRCHALPDSARRDGRRRRPDPGPGRAGGPDWRKALSSGADHGAPERAPHRRQAAGRAAEGAGTRAGPVPEAAVAAPGRDRAALAVARRAPDRRTEGVGPGLRGDEAGDGDQEDAPRAADPTPESAHRCAAGAAPGDSQGRPLVSAN